MDDDYLVLAAMLAFGLLVGAVGFYFAAKERKESRSEGGGKSSAAHRPR